MNDTPDPHGIDAPDEDLAAAGSPADFGGEPSVDALLRAMEDNGMLSGWDGMDNAGQVIAKLTDDQNKAMRAEASLFRRVFGSGDGRKVLEIFLDRTLRRTAWPWQHLQSQDALLAYGLAREAQNGFVAAILQAMAHGHPDRTTKGRDDGI